MPNIIGYERQIAYLNTVCARGTLAHAYFLYGPEHLGKFTIARTLAKAFFCDQTKELLSLERVCGVCRSCRLIENNIHQSVFLIDRDYTLVSKKESRKEIPIDDIRELRRRFSFTTTAGEYRIAILNQIDKMSEEAANSFLKLLEEPGKGALFILISNNPNSVMQTLISRTSPIRFPLLSDAVLEKYFFENNKHAQDRQELLSYAAGRPGVLMRLLEDGDYYAAERKFAHAFAAVEKASLPYALRFAERAAGDETLREKTAEYMVRVLRQKMLAAASGGEYIRYPQKIKRIDRIANVMAATNVNPRLALDAMFLEFGTYL